MSQQQQQNVSSIDWPSHFDRTPPGERGSYPGDISLTRKESFQSVVDELERWGASSVEIDTASQHYVDRPNIPHQHDKPDDVGVVARFRREGEAADDGYAIACDRWRTQLENARAIALYARRMRLAERCGVTTASSTFETARLPPGDDDADVVVAAAAEPDPHDVLGVTEYAEDAVVKAAARRLKADRHPDSGGSTEEFQRVVKAEEALLDG